MKNKKISKLLLLIFKIVVLVLSLYFIYNQFDKYNLLLFKNIELNSVLFLILGFVFVFFNWSLEVQKWKLLLIDIKKISFYESLKSVLIGIVFGLFTPNRIGEPAGRLLIIDKSYFSDGLVRATVGSFTQLFCTLIFGFLGLTFFTFYKIKVFENKMFIFLFLALILVLFIFLFFNFNRLLTFLSKKSFFKRKFEFKNISTKTIVNSLFFSILRYFVFVLQYYLLLVFFKVEFSFFETIFTIFSIYFFTSIIPGFVIADLGIRGGVAIFFLSLFSSNFNGILLTSIVLWFINILLPSLCGLYFFIKTKPKFVNHK